MSKPRQITSDEFEEYLDMVIEDEGFLEVLIVPGVMDLLREEYNNATLELWAEDNVLCFECFREKNEDGDCPKCDVA